MLHNCTKLIWKAAFFSLQQNHLELHQHPKWLKSYRRSKCVHWDLHHINCFLNQTAFLSSLKFQAHTRTTFSFKTAVSLTLVSPGDCDRVHPRHPWCHHGHHLPGGGHQRSRLHGQRHCGTTRLAGGFEEGTKAETFSVGSLSPPPDILVLPPQVWETWPSPTPLGVTCSTSWWAWGCLGRSRLSASTTAPWWVQMGCSVTHLFKAKLKTEFIPPQIHLNSRGLVFSVGLLLASVFFTVSPGRMEGSGFGFSRAYPAASDRPGVSKIHFEGWCPTCFPANLPLTLLIG